MDTEKTKKAALGIAGAGILGTAAYLLLRGKKEQITVQYGSNADRTAAETIAKGLKATELVFGFVDARTITKPLVVVGAQEANPTYAQLVSLGVLPKITTEHAGRGLIYVRHYKGIKVVGVAGYHAAGTQAAAAYLAKRGSLPTEGASIPTGVSQVSEPLKPAETWFEPVFIPGD